MPARCCITTCQNNKSRRPRRRLAAGDEHVKHHRFPNKDEQQMKKWCDFVGEGYVPCSSHRICSLHFEPSCYYRYLNTIIALKKDAVPTIREPAVKPNLPSTYGAEKQKRYREKRKSDASRHMTYKENQLPEPFETLYSAVFPTDHVAKSINDQHATDCIDIKDEFNLNVETKEHIAMGETSSAEFVELNVTVKKEMLTDTDVEREILEPLISIKEEMGETTEEEEDVTDFGGVSAELVELNVTVKKEMLTDTDVERQILEPLISIKEETGETFEEEEDIMDFGIVSAEFVDVHDAVKKELLTDTDVEREILEPLISIKEEMGETTEEEEDITDFGGVSAEFVEVEDKIAPLVVASVHLYNGVSDAEGKVVVWKEEYGSSLLCPKTSDPLCEEEPTQDSTDLNENQPSCIAEDSVLPCENSVPTKPQTKDNSTDKGFTCDKCAKTFKTRQQVITHLKTHSLVKPYACDICSLAFASRGYRTKHMQTHSRKWQFACTVCSKSFRCSALLEAHTAKHNGQKMYACGECGRSYRGKYCLTKHMRRSHNGKETSSSQTVDKVFVCEHCGKRSSTESELKQHMTTHTERHTFRCEQCPKSFATKSYLKNHSLFHTGELPFICETCNRRFATRSGLKKHSLSHSGEKPFECTLCGMKFSFRHNLKTHLIRHTGVKPYACSVCHKTFVDKCNQIRHEKLHTKNIIMVKPPENEEASLAVNHVEMDSNCI